MKTLLLTGATGAIGSTLARMLASRSTPSLERMILQGRDANKLASLEQDLRALNPTLAISSLACDLATDMTTASQAVAEFIQQAGGVSHLVHCVGSTVVRPIHLTSEADWQAQWMINTSSAFIVLKQSIAAALKAKQPLSAVLVSSVVAHAGFANHEAIAAAKAGVAAMAQSAAASYAGKQIRVNVVAPGLTRSGLTQRFIATPEALERSSSMIPSGRIGEPTDVAETIAFLLSDAASHITGQVIQVAGGQGQLHPLRA